MKTVDTNGQSFTRWLMLSLVIALMLPFLWVSLVSAPALRVDVGKWGDHAFLSGIHAVEQSSTENYRWLSGHAELVLPNLSDRYRLLRLRAHGWRPPGHPAPVVDLSAGRSWATIQTSHTLRVYSLLLPHDGLSPNVHLVFQSQVYLPEHDPRQIGFAVDWVELRALGDSTTPVLWHLVAQILLVVLIATLSTLVLPIRWATGLTALTSTFVVWANIRQPLWVSQVIEAWLALAALLVLATWLIEPYFRRWLAPWLKPVQAQVAWTLFLLGLLLRLGGAVHPLFDTHDLPYHTGWLEMVNSGQLYFYSTPAEFQGRRTFNPPAGYVLLMPLWLILPSARLVVQMGVGLFDALGCLLILLIARELRMSARAGLFAMALYLALPINMTMLWWGFATNAMAQTLWLLLVWSLLRLVRQPCARVSAICAILIAVSLLTHVGALVPMLGTLVLSMVVGWRPLMPSMRVVLSVCFVGALLFVGPIYFSAAAAPLLERPTQYQTLTASTLLQDSWVHLPGKLNFIYLGLTRGFLPLPLMLAPLGFIWLVGGRAPFQRRFLLAWLVVCLAFLGVYLSLGLLVRYIYFATPLICLALGRFLAVLGRRYAGQTLAIVIVLLVSWTGAALWFAGVLLRVKPSLVPLTQ